MGKEYRYGKVIRWGQYAIPAVFAILLAALWAVGALVGFLSPRLPSLLPDISRLQELSIASCVLLVPGGVLSYLYYRQAGVRVSLDNEAVVYRDRTRMRRMPFDRIPRVAFRPVRYLGGGWVRLASKEHTIRLGVTLENLPGFLLELKAALDERGLSGRYDRKAFFRFMKKAVRADQSFQRLYSVFWMFILASAVACALAICSANMVGWSTPGTELWVFVSAIWPTVVYLVAEIPFARRVAKGADEHAFTFPPRDVAHERTVYLKAVLLGGFIYVSAFAALLAFGPASW